MKVRTLVLCATALVTLAGCQRAAWKTYTPGDGKCSVLFPSQPIEKHRSTPTEVGTLDFVGFTSRGPSGEYTVMYNDFPPSVMALMDTEKFFAGAIEGVRGKVNVTESHKITVDGNLAREFTGTVPESKVPGGGIIRGRLILCGSRLYQVMALTRSGKSAEDAAKCLDSFKILKK